MMAKPVLMTVDDDAEVLHAVERDLRHQYAQNYRVMRADSGAHPLEALRGLKRRNDFVALFLVDQRMPEMTGVEFLGQAMELYPHAKRVLLTAYADTDAAIRAINDAKIQHYLLKPSGPKPLSGVGRPSAGRAGNSSPALRGHPCCCHAVKQPLTQ